MKLQIHSNLIQTSGVSYIQLTNEAIIGFMATFPVDETSDTASLEPYAISKSK